MTIELHFCLSILKIRFKKVENSSLSGMVLSVTHFMLVAYTKYMQLSIINWLKLTISHDLKANKGWELRQSRYLKLKVHKTRGIWLCFYVWSGFWSLYQLYQDISYKDILKRFLYMKIKETLFRIFSNLIFRILLKR